jgi:membrane protease YdiL (CAAX protease family)
VELPEPLLILTALGLTGLMVILRLDAERFGAAEYAERDKWGRAPSTMRRLSWYLLGIGGIVLVSFVHPDPDGQLFLGLGDRIGAIMWGFLYAAGGTAVALGLAYYRYRYLRFPDVRSYPGALVNSVSTALVDEAVFRGMVFGFLIIAGIDPTLANIAQALIYALATRLGAPGRPWYMIVFALLVGLASGWLTGVTGGVGAAFLGHAVTRFAVFLTTGHVGQPAARGREVEEIEARRRTPAGWRPIGTRDAGRDR